MILDNLTENSSAPETPKKHIPHLLLIGGTVGCILLATVVALAFFTWRYQGVMIPGTSVGIIDVSGLTITEAEALIKQQMTTIENNGITIRESSSGSAVTLRSSLESLGDPDLVRDLFRYDLPKTIEPLAAQIADRPLLANLVNRIALAVQRPNFPAQITSDGLLISQSIDEAFAAINHPAQNARPNITWDDTRPVVTITAEISGQVIDQARLESELSHRLAMLDPTPLDAVLTTDQPTISQAEASGLITDITNLLSTSTMPLTFEASTWQISPKQLAPMIIFSRDDRNQVVISLDYELFKKWVETNIATTIEIEPQSARMEISNGTISSISAHQAGRKIDYQATYKNFTANLPSKNATPIVIITVEPEVTTGNVNDLGIKEIIGIGRSNFAGSPVNRRHNIATGAKKLHGVIIKPGEEFSLINTLGEIDGANGYRTELVIKGNKTTPEYGGGLCQIGTTSFRAALGSGLPITERRNHSYNVSYYLENGIPGVDATIYDPKPDLRFVNDTGAHILIQTRISGDDLAFEFWGTKDGRVATRTTPRTWGRIAAAPTKYIETTDLKPGAKKCTESSHAGLSAAFDYIVTYPSGEEKKNTFTSVYRPWQAVCLIGVAELGISSSTADSIPAPITPTATTTN